MASDSSRQVVALNAAKLHRWQLVPLAAPETMAVAVFVRWAYRHVYVLPDDD